MIHRLSTLRKLGDLRISSLATHLADAHETIEELKDENIELHKKIRKTNELLSILEERLDNLEREED